MAGGQALTEYDTADVGNQISLKKFSPLLRKIGKYILESDEPKTIAQAIRDLKLNDASVWNTISRNRKKGNDFTEFVDQEAKLLLHTNKIAVYRSLVAGAVERSSTSHNDRKLFLQVAGDLKETTSLNINNLTIGVNIQGVKPQDNDRSKGVIDTQPIIPGK